MKTKILVACIAVALIALTVAYRILAMGGSLGGFENDQFVTLSQAQQMAMGDWPVRDFVTLGKPLTILISALGQLTFGPTLFAEALVTAGIIGFCTAVVFLMGWRASGSLVIPLLIALVQVAMAPRFYNHSKLLAYALAIPAMWWYIDRPDRRRLFVMAAAGVVAFLLRHDHGAYVGLSAILAVALVWQQDVPRIAKEVALLGVMALALVAPYLVFVQLYFGLPAYVDSFVRYATRTAERTSGEQLRMSFDWSQPLVIELPTAPQRPHVNIRWRQGTSAGERADRERALRLIEPLPISRDIVNYALTDTSTSHLAAIVRDPIVADTSGIDRQTFVLNDPFYTHVPTRWERTVAYARSLRVLPGVLHRGNAVAFLYYLMYAIPVIAVVVLVSRHAGAASLREPATAKVIVIAALTLMIDRAFLRGNLTSRLADVTEPVGILAAWAAAAAMARRSRAARAAAVAVLLTVFVATSLSVEAIENVSGQVATSGVTAGNAREHAANVHTLLTATPPVDAWPADAPGMEAVARYIRWCTAPDDRVLALGYIPELFFMSHRQFAAGHVWILPGLFNTEAHERLMIERTVRYRVPIVMTVPDPEYTTDYVRDFPRLTQMLAMDYREAGTIDFGRGFRFRVLARRDLTPTSTYQLQPLPCFS